MLKFSVWRTQSHDSLAQEETQKPAFNSQNETKTRSLLKKSALSDFSKTRNSIFEPKHPTILQVKSSKQIPKFLVAKILNDPLSKEESPKVQIHKHTQSENNNFYPISFNSVLNSKFQATSNFFSPQKNSCKKIESPIISQNRKILSISPKKKTIIFPISGKEVCKIFMHDLGEFQRSELVYYSEVYYLGKLSEKQSRTEFDDENGNLIVSQGDQIAYRYEIQSLLGSGSFGQVYKIYDHKTKTEQALKLLSNRSRFQEQAFIEVKLLKFLKKHDPDDSFSVVHIKDYFSFRQHVCITFELLSISLYDLLKNNSFQGLSSSLVRRFASQVLHALLLLKKYKIIHCDLKPENILLRSQNRSIVKVVDFGSSCFEHEKIFTYVQSRFYRAPEVMLGISYTTCVDIWSFGCILAELVIGKPILPGENEVEQMARIIELLGYPPEDLLAKSTRGKDLCKPGKVNYRKPGGRNLKKVLLGMDSDFIDLVEKCLIWEPELRISPKEALEHPWILGTKNVAKAEINHFTPSKHQINSIEFNNPATSHHRLHRKSLQIFKKPY